MSEQTDFQEPGYSTPSGDENQALSNTLSIHYIVMAFYILGIVGSAGMLLLSLATGETKDMLLLSLLMILPAMLFLMHLMAVKGLKKRQLWGYRASKGLGILLLFGFPFGTVLGLILLSQLSKFSFDI